MAQSSRIDPIGAAAGHPAAQVPAAAAEVSLTMDDAPARHERERAFAALAARGDIPGCACVAASALIAIASRHADFRGLALWLERFAAQRLPAGLPAALQLRIDVAHTCIPALDSRVSFADPKVAAHAKAAFDGLRLDLAVSLDERLVCGRVLLDHYALNEDREHFNAVSSLLHPVVQNPAASAYWVGAWWWRLATTYATWGDMAAAATARERAWAVVRGAGVSVGSGVVDLDYAMTAEDLLDHLRRDQLGPAAKLIERLHALSPDVHAVWRGHGYSFEARFHLMRNTPQPAQELCATALRIYAESELPLRERDMAKSVLAHAHILLHDEARAIEILQDIGTRQSGGQLTTLVCLIAGARAARALRLGAPEADAMLREALAAAREIKLYAFFFTLPALAARLFAVALARDIEREFVVKAIRMRAVAAPDDCDPTWPWRLRIRALGGFALERDDEPLRFEGKAQKRPLDLLKALVAAGGDASVDALIDQLWPDVDAKAPRAAFEMTLSRLRKLLDVDGALLLSDGRLQLNRRLVWCDALAFDALAERLRTLLREHTEVPAVVALAARVLGPDGAYRSPFVLRTPEYALGAARPAYAGPLLGSDTAPPWAIAPRERLASRWRRTVLDTGAWLESRSRWAEAVEVYEQGLVHDPLAEPVFCGLLRCHIALGATAQALLAYRRLRDVLARELQVAPGAEAEALRLQIRSV